MMQFSIMTISAFVAALNECVKWVAKGFGWKDVNRFIPIFSLVFGAGLGIWGYFIPSVNMGDNIIESLFIGLAAGAAATGCHQVYKQLAKEQEQPKEISSKDDLEGF